eukprot:TRINITY_DN27713_c0_g1_i1.p1 TRINITY_DN27713_c0_g1~~TRINITY_DN27713_c0_g1_i1.p1  ORF type:complete len:445 (+),score=126.70 TRINITY_DN27713_c0_g1_i1:127-1461(+)
MAEAPLSPKHRGGQKQRPPQLPQAPRKREEFAAGSNKALANAGSRIAAAPGGPSAAAGHGAQTGRGGAKATSVPPLRGRLPPPGGADSEPASAHSGSRGPGPVSARGQKRFAGPTSEREERQLSPDTSVASDAPPRSPGGGETMGPGRSEATVNVMEIAKGGEELVRRLGEMSSASEQMRSQLELQAKEVWSLKESTVVQQQLIRSYEQQLEMVRQQEAATAEARMRREFAETEAKLRADLESERERGRREREELVERYQSADGERMQREGERDEARLRIRELELRLGELGGPDAAANMRSSMVAAPPPVANVVLPRAVPSGGDAETRAKSLEMELALVRARLTKEAEGRETSERASAGFSAERNRLQAEIERRASEERKLRRAVAEQAELAAYREEICKDLQQQLSDQRAKAASELRVERGKVEAVSRLESILPRHILMKALT